jgi:hypothetical protein
MSSWEHAAGRMKLRNKVNDAIGSRLPCGTIKNVFEAEVLFAS